MKIRTPENKIVDRINTFCDKCKKEIITEKFDAFSCQVNLSVGEYSAYGEGFVGDNYAVDLCEPCAKELFFTIMPENNIKVNDLS